MQLATLCLSGTRYLSTCDSRLFWCLALGMAYCSCWYCVSKVSEDYTTSPLIMSVETTLTPSATYPLPAVTVCSNTHISKHKFDFTALSRMENLSEPM